MKKTLKSLAVIGIVGCENGVADAIQIGTQAQNELNFAIEPTFADQEYQLLSLQAESEQGEELTAGGKRHHKKSKRHHRKHAHSHGRKHKQAGHKKHHGEMHQSAESTAG